MAKNQLPIPGTERKSIAEIDDAAEAYVKERDKRVKQSEREVDAKQALIAVMQKHKVEVYKDPSADPPLIVTVTPGKPGVKVTEAPDDDEPEDDGPEE
jgi:hypothetical protein